MDKEDIETTMTNILKTVDEFNDAPTYLLAKKLDMQISILRFIIGEQNFIPLHYFRAAHEKAVKFIDEHDKAEKENTDKGNN